MTTMKTIQLRKTHEAFAAAERNDGRMFEAGTSWMPNLES